MSRDHRRVEGLRRAWLARPLVFPLPSTPKQREGLAYERRVAAALPLAKRGLWYGFEDLHGRGICSPDLVLVLPAEVIIFECKLTDRANAKTQLLELYLPVAEHVHCRPARGVVVAKHITGFSTGVVGTLAEALAAQELPTLHWLGTAPGLLSMPAGAVLPMASPQCHTYA